MTSKDKDVLAHIIMHCDRINEDIERFGDTYDKFESDKAFRDSVSMNILQIGELSKHLSKEFKEITKEEISWQQIYGMRNHFVHGYGSMDDKIVWDVSISDVPDLRMFCKQQIKVFEQQEKNNLSQAYLPDDTKKTDKQKRESLDTRLAKVQQNKEEHTPQTQTQEQTKKPKNHEESLD